MGRSSEGVEEGRCDARGASESHRDSTAKEAKEDVEGELGGRGGRRGGGGVKAVEGREEIRTRGKRDWWEEGSGTEAG